MVSAGAAALFDESGRTEFHRLLAEARGATARRSCRQLRADGTTFEAEIEVSPLGPDGLDGFTMIVRDLTHQQARAAADWSTAETHAHLRSEVELAQRQLWTLQELTDPALNLLGADQFVSELLDRLRSAIHAEGVALVQFGRHRGHLLCASEGLQCLRVHQRSGAAVATDRARAVMIHNDPTAAAEVSAAVWPDDVSSLIAVPLVRAGSTTAVLEVVNRTGRRATEWEIALVQVVAARMARLPRRRVLDERCRRSVDHCGYILGLCAPSQDPNLRTHARRTRLRQWRVRPPSLAPAADRPRPRGDGLTSAGAE